MHPDHVTEPPARPLPPLVLDTNVLLDWLVFQDPSAAALDLAIRSGARQWIATVAMREELEHVLTREHLMARQKYPGLSLATWNRWAQLVEPATTTWPSAMRCTDPDDQKFIDLALQHGAVLLSRDRAVLRLARAGRTRGVRILTPSAWAASNSENLAVNG